MPRLRSRAVLQALEVRSPQERGWVAAGRLQDFRDEACERAAFRLLRQVRLHMAAQQVGSTTFFNLTGSDEDVFPVILARVGSKFRRREKVSILLVNEETRREDEKGPIILAPDPVFGYWQKTYQGRRGSLVVIFVPAGFGEGEPLLRDPRDLEDVPAEQCSGRLTLLWYLAARGYLQLPGSGDARQERRRLRKWKLVEPMCRARYIVQLLQVMREP